MRRSFFLSLAPLLFLPFPTSAAENVAGKYQHCDFACVTIELRPDFTFTYRLHGDIDNRSVHGSWKFIAPNLVLANSNPLPESPPPVAGFGYPGRTTVVAVGAGDDPLPGVALELICGTQHHSAITDSSGAVAFPPCSEALFSLSAFLDGFRPVTFALATGPHNSFKVVLQPEELELTDELWLLHNGKLYIIADSLKRIADTEPERSPNEREITAARQPRQ